MNKFSGKNDFGRKIALDKQGHQKKCSFVGF